MTEGTPGRKEKGASPGVVDSSAPVCLDPRALQATLGFRVPKERASGASLVHLDLRDPLALATKGVRGLLGPLAPQGPQGLLPFLDLTGRLSAFLAPQAHLGPRDPLEPWAPPQG